MSYRVGSERNSPQPHLKPHNFPEAFNRKMSSHSSRTHTQQVNIPIKARCNLPPPIPHKNPSGVIVKKTQTRLITSFSNLRFYKVGFMVLVTIETPKQNPYSGSSPTLPYMSHVSLQQISGHPAQGPLDHLVARRSCAGGNLSAGLHLPQQVDSGHGMARYGRI